MATQVASLFATVGADLAPLNRGLSSAKVALGTFAGNMMTSVVGVLAKAGTAAAGLGKQAIDVAADFESQMAVLSIAAKSSGLAFDDLKKAAIEVGGDTRLLGVSASGSADAMTGLYKAGLTTTEIFGDLQGYMAGTTELGGALRASIDLAAATTLDMVAASDLAAVALATFGGELETEEERAQFITEAMNNLVKAADASVAEVDGLAEALAYVGPSAFQAGLSIQDTNNALAILSTAGIQGSRAGTSLDAMLRSLSDPTKGATEAFNELGIELFNEQGEFKSLSEIIGLFQGALADSTDEQRAAALGAIFTAQGQRSMNVLLGAGVEGWDAMAEATANAAGIQEQASAKANTFAGQMEALEGVVETLMIQVGDALLPVLTDFSVWLQGMVDEHGPAVIAVVEDLVEWFTANLPAAISTLIAVWENVLLPAFTGLWDLIGGTDGLLIILGALGAVLIATVAPILLLGGALIALGFIWNQFGDEVTRIANQLLAVIAHTFGGAMEWIANLLEGISSIGLLGDAILQSLGLPPGFAQDLQNAAQGMRDFAQSRAEAALAIPPSGGGGNSTSMTIYGGLQAIGVQNPDELMRMLWEMGQS